MAGDIFTAFLEANRETESPANYYRWSFIVTLGALLGRNVYIKYGNGHIYPNMYCMLIGTSGTKKSTPIKLCKKLLRLAGYTTIAADKTSKEKFLVDLEKSGGGSGDPVEDLLDQNIFGPITSAPREMFIMADESNDFFGISNLEFLSLLGNLWDYEGIFKYTIKSAPDLLISDPTIGILAGNTPTGFALAFPPEALGQGFFSRTILIHGETTGRKITWPEGLGEEKTTAFVEYFQKLRAHTVGEIQLTADAKATVNRIYQTFGSIGDPRFESYCNRRLSHLLKLSLIYCASRFGSEISERDVVCANTVLTHAEQYMPKALGEFGKAKSSDVSHKIVEYINNVMASESKPATFKMILKVVHQDLEKPGDLGALLQKLVAADKIQHAGAGDSVGFMPKRRVIEHADSSLLDWSILTEEEKGMTV